MQEPEVLNIISESIANAKIGGPKKVIINTLKGLDKIGYPYVLNQDIRNYRYNWIHDSSRGLIEAAIRGIPCVFGPNIAVLPRDLPALRPDLKGSVYLHPSAWCVDIWKEIGFNECRLNFWPAGIDIYEFPQRKLAEGNNVLIYFKRRAPSLLHEAEALVKSKGYNPKIITYGSYNDEMFRQVLSQCIFGIWIGVSESQGIGLQETLASGIPLIVMDVSSLFESSDPGDYIFPDSLKNFKPTSAPYFDNRCGIIVNSLEELVKAIDIMVASVETFDPRSFVLENLSLEKQATDLLRFFNINIDKGESNKKICEPSDTSLNGSDFNLSVKGQLIYLIFILRRKIRTLFKWIRLGIIGWYVKK